MFAFIRCAPSNCALIIIADDMSEFIILAFINLAFVKFAPTKFAPFKLTFGPIIYPLTSENDVGNSGVPVIPPDFTSYRSALCKSVFVKVVYAKLLLRILALVNKKFVKSAPFKLELNKFT